MSPTDRAAEPLTKVWRDFLSPPPGFGEVSFYWWLGDPLDRERIRWQLDQLAGARIAGLQVNYAHGTSGGNAWGSTYASDPPLFSEEWWDLFAWFRDEAGRRGMAVSLSDYTLGIGQGWFCDEIAADPLLRGSVLEAVILEKQSDLSTTWTEETLGAYALGDSEAGGPAVLKRLRPFKGGVEGRADARVVVVRAVSRRCSIDPLQAEVGRLYVEKFFQRFEDRLGRSGPGRLDFFFSDEMDFGVAGHLWTEEFPEQFRQRKGYDIMDELPALFVDIGPRTPKIRLDYRDVMVALIEENYFAPIYRWHEERGLTYGCDHGHRGRKVTEFGDYFRTQRWNQGPGCDQPWLGSDVVKNKVASSIAHLYRRPRVWLEGFYSSGWGTTSAQIADAVLRNFAMGHNLLTLHGLYYSTRGGWWEWAPPCNHFRMPYWEHFKSLLQGTERLSFLLSQGSHFCDVAILYPVAAVEADPSGEQAVDTAFSLAEKLYANGVDFDFIDFQSLAESRAEGGRFFAGTESYRTLVIPAMEAVRFSSVEAAERIVAAGGTVWFVDRLPEASDRAGRGDAELAERLTRLTAGGEGPRAERIAGVDEAVRRLSGEERDFRVLDGDGQPFVQHRKIEGQDLYFVHGLAAGALCEFRAVGRVVAWDLWKVGEHPVAIESATATHTRLRLPEGGTAPAVLWFVAGTPERSTPREKVVRLPIPGPWEAQAVPTLDNRWGDYRLPAFEGFLGPEVRHFDVAAAVTAEPPPPDAPEWSSFEVGFGPVADVFGPSEPAAASEARPDLEGLPARRAVASWRFGPQGAPGEQGYHGLKGRIPDELIVLPDGPGVRFVRFAVWVAEAVSAHWNLGGEALPERVWIDGKPGDLTQPVALAAGTHEVVLAYHRGGRVFAVLATEPVAAIAADPPWFAPLQSRWFNNHRVLPQGVDSGWSEHWVRFEIPPGTRSLTVGVRGELRETRIRSAVRPARAVERDAARFPADDTQVWQIDLGQAAEKTETVQLRIQPIAGLSGGMIVPDPVALTVEPFAVELGDWSDLAGFACYSGGMRYSCAFDAQDDPLAVLDLGDLSASAEVFVNGQSAGIRCLAPWTYAVGPFLRKGRNTLAVEVRSALSNHYKTIPTEYRGSERCGLFGPVTLETRDQAP